MASDLSPDTNSTRPSNQEKILTNSTARLKLETGFSVRNDWVQPWAPSKLGPIYLQDMAIVQKCGEEQLKKALGLLVSYDKLNKTFKDSHTWPAGQSISQRV